MSRPENTPAFFGAIVALVLLACNVSAGVRSNSYDFFREPELANLKLNPSGDLYIGHFTPIGITTIRVLETQGDRTADLFRYVAGSKSPILLLQWVGDRTLIISTRGGGDGDMHDVVRVHLDGTEMRLESRTIHWPGTMVDPLDRDGEHVLWSPHEDPKSAYRVSLDDLALPADAKSPFRSKRRVTRMKEKVARWRCDGEGNPRLAAVDDDRGGMRYWARTKGSGSWKPVQYSGESEDDWIVPVGVMADGHVVVVSRFRTGRLGIYAYESDRNATLEPVMEHEARDLFPLFDTTDFSPIRGALYFAKGRPHFDFSDPAASRAWRKTLAVLASSIVAPITQSRDGHTQILWTGDGSDPGRFVLMIGNEVQSELGDVASRIRPQFRSRIELIEVEVPGVGMIEGYLTMPSTDEHRPPLVVYPHGGPIGVLDLASSNPEVMYLASRGYAVLRVNYRGSGGLGTDFERAGWREWGRGIEDDVDAIFDQVISSGLVDGHRVCIIGASYGGYSALMSVIRHPKRFRCAVSTAGVTDISLLFGSSDFAETEEGRDRFSQVVGDPDRDYEEMKKNSPVYRVREIETPILLIHGDRDRRVDVEHANRLAAMLRLHKKKYEIQIVRGLGHSGWSQKSARAHIEAVADFLDWHLD